MFVAHVRTSIKGLLETELGPRTLVIGAPASHKSGLVDALALGLTGESLEVGKTPGAIAQLANGDAYVDLKLRNDTARASVSFRCVGTAAKASKPVWTAEGVDKPVGVLLRNSVLTLLAKNPQRQREAILRAVAPKDLLRSARKSLPEVFGKEWDAVVAEARVEADKALAEESTERVLASDADVLVTVAELLRAKATTARATVKLGAPGELPAVLSAVEFEKLKFRKTDLSNRLDGARKVTAARNRLAVVQEELVELAQFVASEKLPARDAVVKRLRLLKAAEVLQDFYLTDEFKGDCFVTGINIESKLGAPANISHDFERAVELRTQRQEQLAAMLVRIGEAEAASRGRPAAEVEAEQRELVAEIDAITARLEGALEGDLSAKYEQAADDLRAEEANRLARKTAEDAAGAASKAEGLVEVYKALSKSADRLIAEALMPALADFTAAANLVLPATMRLAVQVFDGRKAVCRVGLVQGEGVRPWKVLSGQERALTLSAFANGWAKSQPEAVRMMVIDDIWLNETGLSSILSGMSAAKNLTQVICCVVDNYGLHPDDWNIVRV